MLSLPSAISTITEALRKKFDSYVDYFYQSRRHHGFAILSKLKEDLNLSAEVGWIMVAFWIHVRFLAGW
jgi:hypothetical protein